MDDRIVQLIASREVHCTLRKQDQKLTLWWRERLSEYNQISHRGDSASPQVVSVLNRLFTLLKFVASPNNEDRKHSEILRHWPSLEPDVKVLL